MDERMNGSTSTGIVVIGRNEGERLKRCLRSLPTGSLVVYVDSGSTDDSVAFAQSLGIRVLALDMNKPFTAARARNAGWRYLIEHTPDLEFIQFIDGDCEMNPGWFGIAEAALRLKPEVAAVFGRLRERFPDRSFYNRLCDDEWNVPVGIVDHCGGNAMIRCAAINAVGGFNEDLIAGEEPDLCLRMRFIGYGVERIESEMGFHDAAMFTFASWWRRARRSGHAYAEHVWRHGARAFPQWRRQVLSILFWGSILPVGGLLLCIFTLIFAPGMSLLAPTALLFVFVLQGMRIAIRKMRAGLPPADAMRLAVLLLVGKFAEMRGIAECWLSRLQLRD